MRKYFFYFVGFLLLIVVIKTTPIAAKFSSILFQLIFNNDIELKKTENTINVLFLGVGGGSHDGPNLTDTIMLGNIDQFKNKVTFISIPRDLWITDIKGKINTAYAIGESRRKGGGLVLTKAVVSKILDKQIDYAVLIDFNGFIKAIDHVGGLDISVDRTFDDYQYPDEDKREDLCGHSLEEATEQIATQEATIVFPCRYLHVHFDKGVQHVDGNHALIYVRSRYAEGLEGTDFARSMRQQKVIKAFRDKIFSAETLLNPVAIINLYHTVSQSIDTDIQNSEFDDFIRLGQKMKKALIHPVVIDYGDPQENKQGLLINPPIDEYNGSWVLIPRKGEENYEEIHQYVRCVLTKDECPIK